MHFFIPTTGWTTHLIPNQLKLLTHASSSAPFRTTTASSAPVASSSVRHLCVFPPSFFCGAFEIATDLFCNLLSGRGPLLFSSSFNVSSSSHFSRVLILRRRRR